MPGSGVTVLPPWPSRVGAGISDRGLAVNNLLGLAAAGGQDVVGALEPQGAAGSR